MRVRRQEIPNEDSRAEAGKCCKRKAEPRAARQWENWAAKVGCLIQMR